jgi:PAS domain-containing protein
MITTPGCAIETPLWPLLQDACRRIRLELDTYQFLAHRLCPSIWERDRQRSSADAAVLEMDDVGMLVQWNAIMSHLTGYAKEDVIGFSVDDYVSDSSRAPLRAAVRRAIQGEEVRS